MFLVVGPGEQRQVEHQGDAGDRGDVAQLLPGLAPPRVVAGGDALDGAAVDIHTGTGTLRGPDPREMAVSDCVVIWGTNAVATQVNVMTHAIKARKDRGAKIVVVDIYDSPTMKQADLKVILKPGTDAALACAAMHVAFRDGYADREYMAKFADDPAGLEAHLKTKTPETGLEALLTGLLFVLQFNNGKISWKVSKMRRPNVYEHYIIRYKTKFCQLFVNVKKLLNAPIDEL